MPTLVYVMVYSRNPDPGIKPWLDGFAGNLIAGIIQAIMFLFLAFYLDGKTEQKIDKIDVVTEEIKGVLKRNEVIAKERELVFQFEQFLHNLSHYDVRFPILRPKDVPETEHLGLEYTIEPVRDPSSGLPREYKTESHKLWIVKVRGPSHIEVRKPADLREFTHSPIKENTYYFCRFFNGSWHMGEGTVFQPHAFYLSGFVGRTEYGIYANQYLAQFSDPLAGMEKLAEFMLDPEGHSPGTGVVSVEKFKIFRDQQRLYLTINDSLPKPIYQTNPPNTYNDTGWFFVIDQMIGFASDEKLIRIETAVRTKLGELNVTIPKVAWHQTDTYRYEPPV